MFVLFLAKQIYTTPEITFSLFYPKCKFTSIDFVLFLFLYYFCISLFYSFFFFSLEICMSRVQVGM